MYGISQMFSILLQAARGILKIVVCTAHFSDNVNSVVNKKTDFFSCLCSIACKKKNNRLNT